MFLFRLLTKFELIGKNIEKENIDENRYDEDDNGRETQEDKNYDGRQQYKVNIMIQSIMEDNFHHLENRPKYKST